MTAKLLTGFDAPILQAMYLDKPLRDHTLLQAVCRTNRTYGEEDPRPHRRLPRRLRRRREGPRVRREGVQPVVANIDRLKDDLPEAIQKCLAFFPGVDRTKAGYEGPDGGAGLPAEQRRARRLRGCVLGPREALGGDLPRPRAASVRDDYRWLSRVYVSVQPPAATASCCGTRWARRPSSSSTRTCTWRASATTWRRWSSTRRSSRPCSATPNPKKKAKEIEIKLTAHSASTARTRSSRSSGAPREPQGALRAGVIESIEFLKQLGDRQGRRRRREGGAARRGCRSRQGRAHRAVPAGPERQDARHGRARGEGHRRDRRHVRFTGGSRPAPGSGR